ncbi:MAG: glycosyltransferase family 4 protein [Bacteroidales bacterium]|nr:glycosyltransferase family 4 protein [Bacteroidales bacterium]
MKILQITHKPPFPAIDGGCIAMYNITWGLIRGGHEVKVLSMSTPKHKEYPDRIPEDYRTKTRFECVYVNTRFNFFKAIRDICLCRSYHVRRFVSRAFAQRLRDILAAETFDIIQLESIFTAPYIDLIRQHSHAKIVLRAHNIEHRIWGRFLIHRVKGMKKWALTVMARQLKKFELEVFKQIDAYLSISETDDQYFRACFPFLPGEVIPVGLDIQNYVPDENNIPSENLSLFYIGSMQWFPNLEGVDWFLKMVLPLLRERYPSVVFSIAGRGIPSHWQQIPNVKVEGEVADAQEYMRARDLMLVPLLSGSGIRVKILEGMALSKAIITTPVGAEGLHVEDGKNILIANTPREFAQLIEKCIQMPEICKMLGENAREYVLLRHDNREISKKLIAFYKGLL